MKKGIFLLLILSFFLKSGSFLFAQEKEKNNKFGIHLADTSLEDLKNTADLVNSGGGDWGHVTLVIQENDRDLKKWQSVFNHLRELHLIPIVRLATSPDPGGFWQKPEMANLDLWVDFLDSLNWVIKKRYVILFNEPNHAAEWGKRVDPQEYGEIAFHLAGKLKERNSDFFIMLAGFDAAAPQKLPNYANEEWFLKEMLSALPAKAEDLSQYLDGWASHSYPNHGFVGSPYQSGRNSIKTYLWELELLKNLGFKKELPVFITETGWPHQEGITNQASFFSAEEVAKNFEIYFKQLINDQKIIAITPFVLNYQQEPFDHFSWRKLNSEDFYPQYELVRSLPKVSGEPLQEQKLEIKTALPPKLIRNSNYQLELLVKNEGQAVWDKRAGYQLKILPDDLEEIEYFFPDLYSFFPPDEHPISLSLKTGDKLGLFDLSLAVAKNGKVVSNQVSWKLEIAPIIDLSLEIKPLFFQKLSGNDFEFLIYDPNEKVIFGQKGVSIDKGKGKIEGINNLVFGQKYRLVLVKSGFLPRQTHFTFVDGQENKASFRPMLPLDLNHDGQLTFSDLFFWKK